MIGNLSIYIVTDDLWLRQIDQRYLHGDIFDELEAINGLGVPPSNIDVYFVSSGGGATDVPYVKIDGILGSKRTDEQVLKAIVDRITAAVSRHIYSKTRVKPAVRCEVCSLSGNLAGTNFDGERVTAAKPGTSGPAAYLPGA